MKKFFFDKSNVFDASIVTIAIMWAMVLITVLKFYVLG